MQTKENVIVRQYLNWLEIVYYITDPRSLDVRKVDRWLQRGSHVTVALPENSDLYSLPEPANRITYNGELDRTTIWNRLIRSSEKEWVLFIMDDEDPDLDTLPKQSEIHSTRWAPALIRQKSDSRRGKQVYQIRLVSKTDSTLFDGAKITDATHYITRHNISLTENPVVIQRESELFTDLTEEEEMRVKDVAPSLHLILGYRLLKERKVAHAAAHFRKMLNKDKLLPFDRLAAVNGLMSCFTEQYKWDQALHLANQAIEAEPRQYLPYLIRFKIFQLNKQWNEAIGVLMQYQEQISAEGYSKAAFDKYISLEETLALLGELAMKTGLRKEALQFFEELYQLTKEEAVEELQHTLLVLSIELLDYDKSVYFFKEIFEGYLPDKLNLEMAAKLHDYLSMFMVNGWYDYPSEVYDMLYEQESENGEYRRRLIVTLTKTNRLERARKLIVKNL